MSTTSASKKYFFNTSWLAGGNLFKMLIRLVIGIFVARYLGPEKYGLMNYVISFGVLFTFFASLGIDNILVRELVRFPELKNSYLGTACFLKLMGSVIAIALIAITLKATGADRESSCLIFIYSLGFFFQAFSVTRFYFEAEVLSKYYVISESLQVVICTAFKIYFIAVDFWIMPLISDDINTTINIRIF